MKRALLLPLFTSLLLTAREPSPIHSAEQQSLANQASCRAAAQACLSTLRQQSIQGLPSDKQLQDLSSFFSPGLINALRHATVIQEREQKRAPDEKPPWIEGDLFSSLSEGVTSWSIEEVYAPDAENGFVTVAHKYIEKNQPEVRWADLFVFVRQGEKWLLDDMLMGGDWAQGHTLRENLPGGERQDADHLSPDEWWAVKFTMEGDAVAKMIVQAADKSSAPHVIVNREGDHCLSFKTYALWNPDSTMLAIRLGEGPRTSEAKILRLKKDEWMEVTIPDWFQEERKTAAGNGFREDTHHVDPLYWQDERTLVLLYVNTWSKDGEGDGMVKHVTVRFEEDGSVKQIRSVEAPPEAPKLKP